MPVLHYRAEVVIAGAGIAGICAAIEALDRGRSVVLLDRDEPAQLGGLAREAFGGLWFAGTPEQRRWRIRDSAELGLRDWLAFGELGPEERWGRAWAETYVERCVADVHDWLTGLGIRFLPLPMWVERGLSGNGNSVPRWHVVQGTGLVLVETLARRLLEHPRRARLELKFQHRVDALTRAAGRICGVTGTVETQDQPFEATAESVVIASGGISGDLDRVRRHWPADCGRPPATLLNGAHRFADGHLHDAVSAAGAAVTHLDWQWNYAAGIRHWRPRRPAHGLSLVPPKSALWLNARGERIGPRPLVAGFDTHELVARLCAEPGGYGWLLLNRRIALRELAVSGAEFNPALRDRQRLKFLLEMATGQRWLYDQLTRNSEDVVLADDLPELVERMNAVNGDDVVDLAAVADAVVRYDAGIARGPRFHTDEQLLRIASARRWLGDRLRTCAFAPIGARRSRPLLAIRACVISRKSMGGIRSDLAGRVLDAAGRPLPGLYAAGEAAGFGGGGMHGKRSLEGTFLGGCILTGRSAGRNV
ncbi:MAG: FAD-binding dehydrogenase [Gammaproteobacteria bacterium]|nr:FAD-binding dehydrogenase [Gammaproteobacteria bacterium]